MQPLGRWLIVVGVVLIIVGAILSYTDFFTYLKLGRLSGDIHVKRDHFQFYFPITTCIVLSLVLTLVLYFLKK